MTSGDGVQVKGITSLTNSTIKSCRAAKALLGHVEFWVAISESTGRTIFSEMRTKPICTSASMAEGIIFLQL